MWRLALGRVVYRLFNEDVSLVAGGVALFAILALMPAIATIITLYSLVSNPADIAAQVAPLGRVVPPAVVAVVTDQLEAAADTPGPTLGLATAFSLALAVFSATGGVRSLMSALSMVRREPDTRPFLRRTGIAIALGLGAIVTVVTAVGLIVVLPTAFRLARLEADTEAIIAAARWPALLLLVMTGLGILYRVGTGHRPRHIRGGTLFAGLAWLASSYGLSLYVDRVANYSGLYGAFGGVMIVLLWFYVSSLVILIGALINEEVAEARWRRGSAGAPPPPTPAPRSLAA
ncbi:MAG TPA: YihY/virulence factor BrkB family protein [Kofleriaceae bacterium]|nr:YihY/virulence factor BrkB family protein [Kofleriaceae bacterium]